MKVKKMSLITVIAFGIVCLTGINALAGWYDCEVIQAGPSGSHTYLKLTDTDASPAFTAKWFEAHPNIVNSILATALTAMSLGQKVQVQTDLVGSVPIITNLYLLQDTVQ